MNITKLLEERYTVKKFDTEFKLSAEQLSELKALLQLAPSSVNVQPWQFTIATTKTGIESVAKSTANFGFNDEKIRDAAVLVVLSVKDIDDNHLNDVTETEDQDGRYPQPEFKEATDNGRRYFYNFNKEQNKGQMWLQNQVYLNAGYFTMGAAAMGLDTVIMEGFDPKVLTDELQLKDQTPVLIIGVGKGARDDYNKDLSKSRLAQEKTIKMI